MDLYMSTAVNPGIITASITATGSPAEKTFKRQGLPGLSEQGYALCPSLTRNVSTEPANARGIFTCTRMRFKGLSGRRRCPGGYPGDDTDGIAAEMEDAEGLLGNYF